MKTERVKREPQSVMFAECKANPGNLQVWFPAHSIIYCKCHQCGTKTSYASSNVLSSYADHFNLYKIEIKKLRGEDWDVYWARAEAEVLKDLQKYVYISG